MTSIKFYSFNSINWSIRSENKEFLESVCRDYELYRKAQHSDCHFEILIDIKQACVSPKVFMISGKSYEFSLFSKHRHFKFDEDLFGIESDQSVRSLKIFGSNTNRLREVVLSYVNSVLGEMLDIKGWHRLHAMAVVLNQEAVVVPLNSNSGKSSCSYWILQKTKARILSDETVYTDGTYARGFLTRIALRTEPFSKFETYRRKGDNQQKYLIGISDQSACATGLFLFQLWLPENHWSRIGFLTTFVLGLGSAQMVEFMIRPKSLSKLMRIFVSRMRMGLKFLRRPNITEKWSSDESQNFRVIEQASNLSR